MAPKLILSLAAALAAGNTLLAQINLGDVLRRRPPLPVPVRPPVGNPGGVFRGGAPSAEKCKALVDWMSTLQREYPQINLGATMVDALYPKAVNLFRDATFEPFYGKSFTQTPEAERRNYQQTVFRFCGPNQLSQQDLATLQTLRVIVERPFLLAVGSFSYQEVIAGIAERELSSKWKKDTMQELGASPATVEGFDKLEAYRAKGTTELAKLWPSEQQQFMQAVDARRKAVAQELAGKLADSVSAVKPGFAGAREIATIRAGAARYLKLLDAESQAKLNARFDQAASAKAQEALPQERTRLAALPAGIDGALAFVAWRREFDTQMSGVPATPEVALLRGQAMAKRHDLLTQGLAEFKKIVAQYPKAGPKDRKADELIRQLFPGPEDAGLAELDQYQSLLIARVAEIKAAESARQAAEEAKKAAEETRKAAEEARKAQAPPLKTGGKPAHPCDTLAAHPEDPRRVSEGVADDKITPAAAQQCLSAVKQSPSTARFQFQLGRAYWAAKQYDKAVPALLKAQEAKYAPAFFYLGEAYRRGLIKGEKADPEFAKELYQMAAAEGFGPAIVALGGTVPPAGAGAAAKTAFDPKLFVHADWMKALLDGDVAKLNQNRLRVLVYALGMQQFLMLDPNEFDPTCLKRVDHSIAGSLDAQLNGTPATSLRMPTSLNDLFRMAQAMEGPIARVPDAETIQQDGVDDMNALSQNFGGCMGADVGRMYTTLKRFVREKPEEKRPEVPATKLRPPGENDLRGGPAAGDRARQDLYLLAGQGQMLMECSYTESKLAFLFWSKSIPQFSESLRGAFPGVAPVVLAYCPNAASTASYIHKNFTEKGASAAQGEQVRVFDPAQPAAPGPRGRASLRPGAYSQNEAQLVAEKQQMIECHYPGINYPVYLWSRSLPLTGGQVNVSFLEYMKTARGIMPAAVDACPAKYSDASALQRY